MRYDQDCDAYKNNTPNNPFLIPNRMPMRIPKSKPIMFAQFVHREAHTMCGAHGIISSRIQPLRVCRATALKDSFATMSGEIKCSLRSRLISC